ncbi:NAD-dependent protein deacetylase, SIR2 family [Bernardetia litoralis DSM 6794]|uniref:NAD-dependent protein deacylase n=2 Tax=Bernardetia litoralis TaxID=999 RepID=I4AFA0_BERLS|nr:NAD-dependent protein deacetylase, SIR2 family [Bernardetia litoralis DSM 6794]
MFRKFKNLSSYISYKSYSSISMRKKIVVLTGAGVSAESGIATFRASDGLWEGHRVEEVASPKGWEQDPEKVLKFYNERRKGVLEAVPNEAHKILAQLERNFDVTIITQNVDDLHERAGSTHVLHLHGELMKARSSVDESYVVQMDGWELKMGEKCPKGHQMRPYIVWFGEAVPMMEQAMMEAMGADIFVVVGTSLLVYPAAGLLDYAPRQTPKYIIDPKSPAVRSLPNLHFIEEVATTGMKKLEAMLMRDYTH